jgi:hypothetical protein
VVPFVERVPVLAVPRIIQRYHQLLVSLNTHLKSLQNRSRFEYEEGQRRGP